MAHMDIRLDMECDECGWIFKRNLMALGHGKVMKCPFCSGTRLALKGDRLVEGGIGLDKVDRSVKDNAVMRKFKP